MKPLLLVILSHFLLTAPSMRGGTITLDFDVSMDWRYDLGASAMDPSFQPLAMNVRAILDDQRMGSIFFPPDTTRIIFGEVQINSPLSSLVDMGLNLATLNTKYSSVSVQDTFISPSNQGTWTSFYEEFSNSGANLGRSLQFSHDPRLPNPSLFGSAELLVLLVSHLGDQYGYREDITFPGGGYQHHGVATLTKVSYTGGAEVPEPSSYGLIVAGTMLIATLKRRGRDRQHG